MHLLFTRLLDGLGLGRSITPEVSKAFSLAHEEQAIFQLELPSSGRKTDHQYLSCKDLDEKHVVLTTREPFFMVPGSWERKTCLFRFLVQTKPNTPPVMHRFNGRIVKVERDRRTISVALPRRVVVQEQRRNVRIRPTGAHMPGLVLWGVLKNRKDRTDANEDAPRMSHNILLDMPLGDKNLRRTLVNISAGGMRLSLPASVHAHNPSWFEPGRKLIAQLVFSGPEMPDDSRFLFVARVSNARIEPGERPEIGVQFLAERRRLPEPEWRELEGGSDALARVLHRIQVYAYSAAKERMVRLTSEP